MINSYRTDVVGFWLVSLLVPAVVLLWGDALYIGLWYYFAVPAVAWLMVTVLGVRPGFLTGVAIGLAVEFVLFLQINWTATGRPDGLIGILHLFSLPGAAAGLLIAALLVKRRGHTSSIAALLFGGAGVFLGFTAFQLVFFGLGIFE